MKSAARSSSTMLSCLLLASILGVAGCVSQTTKRTEAQQHWNQVRADVKLQLATQQYDAGLFDDVVKTLTECVAQRCRIAKAYVLLAQAHLELGDLVSAEATLQAAATANLTSPELHYVRGVVLEQRHELDKAAASYAEARKLNPDNVDFLVAQVECLVDLGRVDEARAIMKKMEERALDHPRVAALAGHLAALQGDTDEAIQHYRTALASNTQDPLIAEELSRLLVQERRFEEALSVARPFVNMTETSVSTGALHCIVATCELALGDPVSAKAVINGYAHVHPKDPAAQLLLAKSAIALGDWLTALRAVNLAEEAGADRIEVRLLRAVAQWKRGDLSASRTELQQLIQLDPNDAEVHCLLAEVYRALGQTTEAVAQFENARRLDASSAWAIAGLSETRQHTQATPPPHPIPTSEQINSLTNRAISLP